MPSPRCGCCARAITSGSRRSSPCAISLASSNVNSVHGRRFAPADRAFLAALVYPLPRDTLRRLRLLVRPDTVLRWHRDLLARRHESASHNKKGPGRPRPVRSIRVLVVRLARENPAWGYRRIHGELAVLGIKVAASTVWEILTAEGIDPAPEERTSATWAAFLRSQADALLAMDFIETLTLTGQRQYILAVIEHRTGRIRILGTTAHPTAAWVTQAVKNLAMDLQDAGATVKFLIRDRDVKYPALIGEILADAGIETVLSGVRMPRMNSIMERWVGSLRRELLDRTLTWNEAHLRRAVSPGSSPAARATRTDHRSGPDRPPRRTPTRPPRRHPRRVPTCCLTCPDVLLDTHKVMHSSGVVRRPACSVSTSRWPGWPRPCTA